MSGKLSCKNVFLLIISFLFSFFNIYIFLEKDALHTKCDYSILFFDVVVLTWIVYIILKKICNYSLVHKNKNDVEENGKAKEVHYFLCVCTIQILFWLPVFLAYYPGLFAYDVASQIPQKIRGYSTHHPLAHTLYLQFFYYIVGEKILKSYTKGIAVATLLQMILFSATLSYMHTFLKKINLSRKIRYFFIVITGILPVFSLLAISATKDIFFSGCVVLLITSLGYWYKTPQLFYKKRYVVYIVSIIGTILFRNNGVYPIVALGIAVIIYTIKNRDQYKLAVYTILGIVLGVAIILSLQYGLHAAKGSINEALSLPYQQIACAYMEHQEEIDKNDQKIVKTLIPAIDHYRGDLSDNIKGSAKGGDAPKAFLKIYLKFMLKYPESYLKAFSKLNAGYLCLTDISFAKIYGTENRQGIFLTDTKDGFDVYHRSFFPALEQLYEELYTKNKYENVVGLNVLCSPAFYFWLTILGVTLAIIKKTTKLIPMIIFIVVLLLTILAGPCALIRYALPYIVCIPVLFVCVMEEKNVY